MSKPAETVSGGITKRSAFGDANHEYKPFHINGCIEDKKHGIR